MKRLFLIIGAPGSGKTTDAELIAAKHHNITHYSTGDMFRAEVASGSQRGAVIDSYISKGHIVPIDIAIETIVGAIKNAPTDVVVIDGYPRSVEQMVELDKYLENEDEVQLVNCIEVEVSQDTAFQRVLGRAADAQVVRADDNEAVFLNRMKLFIEPLEEIREFYTKKELLKVISGEATIKEIVEEMDAFIQSRI
jgi:adenylate kinase